MAKVVVIWGEEGNGIEIEKGLQLNLTTFL